MTLSPIVRITHRENVPKSVYSRAFPLALLFCEKRKREIASRKWRKLSITKNEITWRLKARGVQEVKLIELAGGVR